MTGSAGPSGCDVDQWKQILLSKNFAHNGDELAISIANMAKILATEKIQDRNSIAPFIACRLIPLDKDPGIRPIGIGEVLRRLIGKAILKVLKTDIQNYVGCKQLCAGQEGGIEGGIHAATEIFRMESCEGLIQVDAKKAFNSLNRKLMLHNLEMICPELSTFGWNCYSTPARLFILGGEEIQSE